MTEHQIEEEVDVYVFFRYFYKKRRLIFRVLILSIILSLFYSLISFVLKPPVYQYTSQSVINILVSEGAEYQKPMFISYLGSQIVFDESAKSIGLNANYALWRDSIVIENIVGTSHIAFKISSTQIDKLVELNRRITSTTIFQTSNILLGITTQTVEEAELLEEIHEVRGNVAVIGNLVLFSIIGLIGIIGWLTTELITDTRIKRSKDVETFTGLPVIGTIPDFRNLTITEEVNLRNFARGLIWKKKK